MKFLIEQTAQLLAEHADVEHEVTDVEEAAKTLDVTDADEQALVDLVENLRTFAQRNRDTANRVAAVQYQMAARLTQLRDARRAA